MFYVADSLVQKTQRIRFYLRMDPMIAVLLAAANVEWTIGRCILFFSQTPNVHVHEQLQRCHGLAGYNELWKRELSACDPSFPPLTQVIQNWQPLKEAFILRHQLIHGRDTCSESMARDPIKYMLAAANDLEEFAALRGKDLHARAPIRRRRKAIAANSH